MTSQSRDSGYSEYLGRSCRVQTSLAEVAKGGAASVEVGNSVCDASCNAEEGIHSTWCTRAWNGITDASKINLNLGSGVGLLSGFINVDILRYDDIQTGWVTKDGRFKNAVIEENSAYCQGNLVKLPFPDDYADYACMQEVIEHIPIHYVKIVMAEIYRVMKPGAMLMSTTPDFNRLAKHWVEEIASKEGVFDDFQHYGNVAEVIYGNQTHDGEFHRCPMTPDFMNYIHRVAGFRDVRVFVWERYNRPHKRYPGMCWPAQAICRCDTILTEAYK